MQRTIRKVLIDLSGTLHVESDPIPGAVEALQKLRNANVAIKFVTNTTKESRRILHERLTSLGFQLAPSEIHSSLAAAHSLLVQRRLKPMLLLSPEAMEDFEDLVNVGNEKPDAVVVGLAPTEFHYERLNEAFRALLEGAQLIAIHSAKYYKRSDGLALGPGCFVKGLEYSAQCKAEIVGKPNESFFKSALEGQQSEECVMIGDDAMDDIQGALNAGMKGILVQTGKYRSGDEKKIVGSFVVVPSFVEAVEKLLDDLRK